MSAVAYIIRKAVVLCLNDNIFECSGLYNFGNHTIKFAFLFYIAHKNCHSSAFLQGAILFHHCIIHNFNKFIPVLYAWKVMLNRIISEFTHNIWRFIHDIGIHNNIPVWRMPENKLRAFGNIAVQDVKTAVQIINVAFDFAIIRSSFCCSASAHIIAYFARLKKGY